MTGNIKSSYKFKKGKKTAKEDAEDDVDEIPDSYFSKSTASVFDKIDNSKAGVLTLSKLLTLLKHLGRVFIVRIWWVICIN